MTALTAMTVTADDRRLLGMFVGWSSVSWDAESLDWSFGSPMFSLAPELLARLDRLLLDGLLEAVEEPGKALWQVVLTAKGKDALR